MKTVSELYTDESVYIVEEKHRPGFVAIAVNPPISDLAKAGNKFTVFFKPDPYSPRGRTKSIDISHHQDINSAKKAKADYIKKYKDHGVAALDSLDESSQINLGEYMYIVEEITEAQLNEGRAGNIEDIVKNKGFNRVIKPEYVTGLESRLGSNSAVHSSGRITRLTQLHREIGNHIKNNEHAIVHVNGKPVGLIRRNDEEPRGKQYNYSNPDGSDINTNGVNSSSAINKLHGFVQNHTGSSIDNNTFKNHHIEVKSYGKDENRAKLHADREKSRSIPSVSDRNSLMGIRHSAALKIADTKIPKTPTGRNSARRTNRVNDYAETLSYRTGNTPFDRNGRHLYQSTKAHLAKLRESIDDLLLSGEFDSLDEDTKNLIEMVLSIEGFDSLNEATEIKTGDKVSVNESAMDFYVNHINMKRLVSI